MMDVNEVHDRESFFRFVHELILDKTESNAKEKLSPSDPYSPAANRWENITIEDFLDAALRWAYSTDMGVSQGLPEEPSWKAFAVFLYLGKIYE